MRGLLLNAAYSLALVGACPIWLMRMVRHGKYRRDWPARLGLCPRIYGLQPVIWIHGVSVGEINAAKALVDQLHGQMPDYRVVVSSTTDTGMAAAGRLFSPEHTVFRWPMDLTFAVDAALNRIGPTMVILMEGDVWPNFLSACNRRGIPVVVVNARLGPRKGFPRYRMVRPLAARMFNRLAAIGAQHETYADMFRTLGVREEKLFVTGMMKYDSAQIGQSVDGQESLAAAMGIGPDDRLLGAGGTGRREESIVLDAFAKLGPRHERARLAIVPRKPERFEEVARLIRSRGLALARRSRQPDGCSPEIFTGAVFLGDTMGELRKFYGLAHAVFAGRSLVPEGGSDMIEAAALAKPVAFGPHTFNFPQAESMVQAGCARRVADAGELADAWAGWLDNPDEAADIAQKAQQFVRSRTGATGRNVEMICRVLGRQPALAHGGIATDEIEPV